MGNSDSNQTSWFDDEYPEDLRQFLLERGAIGYLSFLSQEPRRFVEMKDELAMGDGTLHELHTRALGLGLRDASQRRRDGKLYRVHQLTPMGELVVGRMRDKGVTQRHERLRTVRQEYEQAKGKYIDWVEDDDGYLPYVKEYLEMVNPENSTESPDTSSLDPLSDPNQFDQADLDGVDMWDEPEDKDESTNL